MMQMSVKSNVWKSADLNQLPLLIHGWTTFLQHTNIGCRMRLRRRDENLWARKILYCTKTKCEDRIVPSWFQRGQHLQGKPCVSFLVDLQFSTLVSARVQGKKVTLIRTRSCERFSKFFKLTIYRSREVIFSTILHSQIPLQMNQNSLLIILLNINI